MVQFMGKEGRTFPREGLAQHPKISLAIQTLVESIEQRPIKYFVKTLQKLNILAKHDSIFFVKSRGHFHNDGSLLDLPEAIEDAVGYDHDAGLLCGVVLVVEGVVDGVHVF